MEMRHPFLEYFKEYTPEGDKRAALSGAFLSDVRISVKEALLEAVAAFPELVPEKTLRRIEEDLAAVYDLRAVRLRPRYPEERFSADCWPELAQWAAHTYAICNGFLTGSTATLDKGVLHVSLANGGVGLLTQNDIPRQLSLEIRARFGVSAEVRICGADVCPPSPAERTAKLRQALAESAAMIENDTPPWEDKPDKGDAGDARKARPRPSGPPRIAAEDLPYDPASTKVILGRPIKTRPCLMSEVGPDSGGVTVWGDVFDVQKRETRDGKKYILSLCATDCTSSVMVKLVDDKSTLQPLVDLLEKEMPSVLMRGIMVFDKYERDNVLRPDDVSVVTRVRRKDEAEQKRVELHLHTNMSALDAVSDIASYVKRAASWGHTAVAVTDHGVLQAFPDAMNAARKAGGIKVLYGTEAYFVDDAVQAVYRSADIPFGGHFVVFDVETTGLSAATCRLTEIGAVRVKNGEVCEEFHSFVNPGVPIPAEITKITGITDAMVREAPSDGEALRAFFEFCGDGVLVAHNAPFDMSFLRAGAERNGLPCGYGYIDTVPVCRAVYPDLKNHKLNTVAGHLGLTFRHHRASDDAGVLAQILLDLFARLTEQKGIDSTGRVNTAIAGGQDTKKLRPYHMILLVKNYTGLKNLYKLVSKAHLEHFFKKHPRIPRSELVKMREGLIIGSACEAGELFAAIVDGRPRDELLEIASFYDYLEIQPVANNMFLIRKGKARDIEHLREFNRTVVSLADELHKPVVATCDCHFLDPEQEIYRRVLLTAQGFDDAGHPLPLYFRTTPEMLEEFSYLGEEKAFEVVVTNTNLVADWCEPVDPVPKGSFPPEMPGAQEELTRLCNEGAARIYGEPLPEVVEKRLEKELNSIITHGFAVMYMIAQRLVAKSLSDGYLVGSRGSVGSSFVAFLSGITEVNALPPHYVCPACRYNEFIEDGSYEAGVDMPPKVCPGCGQPLKRDGFDIPFETFLGFEGDKTPDIDLNFSGEYQSQAHKYTEVLFGEGYVFRAGTIGTLAEKTAFGYVKKFMEQTGAVLNRAEETRLVRGCTGVRRTTGQHPGGVMIVPKSKEIYDFCPVQHPADDTESDIITTHFDYQSVHDNILKLDILGHDDPTVIRMLEDITGVNAREIPLDDRDTMSLFTSPAALGLEPDEIIGGNGAIAIPEFGTRFVRQMLQDTMPTTFGELVRISGLSHGTDVWLGNAADLIKDGTANLKQAICTRDDIMLYLILRGMKPKLAFTIMESVRKGKRLKPEWEPEMREHDVPEWYIASCNKISYMFPRAHAVAYVTMAFRIAWFKVHYPLEFYAAYYTVRADDFDAALMTGGVGRVVSSMKEIEQNQEATQKEKNTAVILEVCYEMYKRGLDFWPIDLYESDARVFKVKDGKLLPPLSSLSGVGLSAANAIVKAREDGPFISVDEFSSRSRVSKSVVEVLTQNGVLEGMPESSQLSFL